MEDFTTPCFVRIIILDICLLSTKEKEVGATSLGVRKTVLTVNNISHHPQLPSLIDKQPSYNGKFPRLTVTGTLMVLLFNTLQRSSYLQR